MYCYPSYITNKITQILNKITLCLDAEEETDIIIKLRRNN